MLHLNPKTPKFIKARRDFHQGVRIFVLKRIEWLETKEIVQGDLVLRLFNLHIMDNLDSILIGMPAELIEISNHLNPFIDSIPDFRSAIEYVFNYNIFRAHTITRFDAYQLAELIDVRTCTYCNRNYTNTVVRTNGEKLTRPQFDHYFDQSTHPVLALSFYNLIPSCSICNSNIKGTHKMNLNDYAHPYLDKILSDVRFTYKYSAESKTGLSIEIKTPSASKAEGTVKVFALEEVYNCHTSEVLDLIRTKQYFSDRYLSTLENSLLNGVISSREELYRMAFGTELNELNFINRPFSKFKSDLLKELRMI